MKIKRFNELNHYKETYWTRLIDNKDVTITISDIEKYLQKVKPINILVNDIKNMSIHKDKKDKETLKRVNQSDNKYPIIISKSEGKYTMILDGHHRLQKAINNNYEYISAKILDLNNAPREYKIMFT